LRLFKGPDVKAYGTIHQIIIHFVFILIVAVTIRITRYQSYMLFNCVIFSHRKLKANVEHSKR